MSAMKDHLLDLIEEWQTLIRGCDVQMPETAIAEITSALFAHPDSCVWHETTRWLRAHDNRPRCVHCGSRGTEVPHPICVALVAVGQRTPPVDDSIPCPCARCKGVTG